MGENADLAEEEKEEKSENILKQYLYIAGYDSLNYSRMEEWEKFKMTEVEQGWSNMKFNVNLSAI